MGTVQHFIEQITARHLFEVPKEQFVVVELRQDLISVPYESERIQITLPVEGLRYMCDYVGEKIGVELVVPVPRSHVQKLAQDLDEPHFRWFNCADSCVDIQLLFKVDAISSHVVKSGAYGHTKPDEVYANDRNN